MIDDDIINLQQILNEGTKMLQATNGTYLSFLPLISETKNKWNLIGSGTSVPHYGEAKASLPGRFT